MNALPPPPPPPFSFGAQQSFTDASSLPPIYTKAQAKAALSAEPKVFKISIDGKSVKINELYNRLMHGPAPEYEISIYHPDAWSMTFNKYDPESNEWIINRSDPLGKYGVLVRSVGTIAIDILPEDLHEIWNIITEYFSMAWPAYHAAEIRRGRVQNIYAKKLLEAAKNAGIPENVDPLLESFLKNRPRVTAWAQAEANLARINTSLFHNNNNNNNPLSRINTNLLTKNKLSRKSRRSNRKTRKTRKN